jgi:hypothetical protein
MVPWFQQAPKVPIPLKAQQKAYGNIFVKRLRFEAETKRAHLVIFVSLCTGDGPLVPTSSKGAYPAESAAERFW